MKRFLIVLGLLVSLCLTGCVRWPTVVVGDSSGYLQYNRATGLLEVIWEKHLSVKDTVQMKSLPDSIKDR